MYVCMYVCMYVFIYVYMLDLCMYVRLKKLDFLPHVYQHYWAVLSILAIQFMNKRFKSLTI